MDRCGWRKQNVQNNGGRRIGFMTDKDQHTRSKELMDRCHMDRDVKHRCCYVAAIRTEILRIHYKKCLFTLVYWVTYSHEL